MHTDDEVNARIAKASAAFAQLSGSIRDQSGIRRHKAESIQIGGAANTIINMRNLDVYQQHAERMIHFHTSCLRKLPKDQVA